MSLLRLQAVNRKHHVTRRPILLLQQSGILLPRRQHALITLQIVLDRVFRQDDVVAVQQLKPKLRHGPMPNETPMTQPTENVPTDHPAWHGQKRFAFRADHVAMIPTGAVGAVGQLANQHLRPIERKDPTTSMSANMQPPPALATPTVLNLQHHLGPSRILRQTTSHDPLPPCNDIGRQ